jgi:multiple sugar transport system ATP-binding protein
MSSASTAVIVVIDALSCRTVSRIVFEGVSKVFSGGVTAVDDVSLTIESGEFMVLVGPSGCGKTTLLRMLAGLETTSGGRITIGDRDVTTLEPRERDLAMVFQNYALYPHMSVRDNLAYGLKMRRTPKSEIGRRVQSVAELLGLDEMLERRPRALSGGQRQRVAMGRAIVREPAAYLMDEPLSNLDAKLRVSMRAELARLHERLGTTTVYVTHDQVEAMTLGQRVAVMRDGRMQQVDEPQTLYRDPANLFVAAFIGSPSMNLVEALVSDGAVEFGGYRIPIDPARRPSVEDGARVILGVRPEDFEDVSFAESGLPQIEVSVEVVEELGSDIHVIFEVDTPRVEAEELRAAVDEEDRSLLADSQTSLFNARINPRARAKAGERLKLAVRPADFHFFDLATGRNLLAEAAAVA